MKTLLLLISLVSFSAFAQVQPPPADSTIQNINLRMEKAGSNLQYGSRRIITGTLLMIGGGALMALSNDDPNIMLVGAGLATVGFFVNLDGGVRIGRAGKNLRGKGL
jgi:hypothetical protein